MASFRFRTGNAAQLLRLPVYAAGRLATTVIPRGGRWVFGCGAGIGDGALALWQVAQDAGHDTLWLAGSDEEMAEARARGIRAVPKMSLRGWWATARAGVVVVTHGLGDANRYALSGAFITQLWHGIPLKRIGLDSPATTQVPRVPGAGILRRIVALLYRASSAQIRVLPAASDRARGRLESAFGLDNDQVVVTGEPRVDVLSAGSQASRRAAAQRVLIDAVGAFPKDARVVMYAPTWRDGDPDPAIPSHDEWLEMVTILEQTNSVLLIRSHPMGQGSYRPPFTSARIRLLGANLLRDVTPALSALDVLITDYSSLAYDAGLIDLPVIYFAPDAARYAQTRGFYGRYDEVAGDAPAENWSAVLAQLAEILPDSATRSAAIERGRALSSEMHAFRDGRNTYRVYEAMSARGVPAPRGAV